MTPWEKPKTKTTIALCHSRPNSCLEKKTTNTAKEKIRMQLRACTGCGDIYNCYIFNTPDVRWREGCEPDETQKDFPKQKQ